LGRTALPATTIALGSGLRERRLPAL
jgi:hypothetical protein